MHGRIDNDGNLVITRYGFSDLMTECPHSGEPCNIRCPRFGAYKEARGRNGERLFVLTICDNRSLAFTGFSYPGRKNRHEMGRHADDGSAGEDANEQE